jgi:hypothetical protein
MTDPNANLRKEHIELWLKGLYYEVISGFTEPGIDKKITVRFVAPAMENGRAVVGTLVLHETDAWQVAPELRSDGFKGVVK